VSDVKVTQLLAVGDDVLLVRGERDDEILEARGWVSAIENHLPPEAYDADGNRLENKKGQPKVTPRRMTSAEKRAYAKRLLLEQNPEPVEIEL
jgi:hypothetical protein